jgi:hypothetical protein
VLGGFTLPLLASGVSMRSSHADDAAVLEPERVWGDMWEEEGGWVSWNSVRLEMPPHSSVRWPTYPFNPYAVDDAAPAEQAVAVVVAKLTPDRPECRFVLRPA